MFVPRPRKQFTQEQLETARQLRADSVPWTRIAILFGCSADCIHAAIDEEYREIRNSQARGAKRVRQRRNNAKKAEETKSVFPHYVECRSQPSPDALAERARAFSRQRSLTAEFCGDPLPGRSALDKRESPCG